MGIASNAIAGLSSEEKRAVLARLLQERVARSKSFPPTFGQERLWFLDQLEPGNAAYNWSSTNRLIGQLDAVVLERSLNEIVAQYKV